MSSRYRSLIPLTMVLLLLCGCAGTVTGDDTGGSAPSSPPSSAPAVGGIPTAEDLAAELITADDLDGTWTVNVPPGDPAAISGVVSAEQQAMLPRIELCDDASQASRAAAQALRWQAFRQLDQTEENPIDMTAGDRVGHLVFVQEYLMSGDPATITQTFTALRDGLQACQGEIPAGQEGPGRTEPMAIPDVGEDRYGDLTTLAEAGGGAYWLLHNSLVRDGPVLMDLQIVDIVMGEDVSPEFTPGDIAAILTIASDKLG